MYDLLINLLASVIAGIAVWLGGRLVRYRRLARERAFFGLDDNGTCLLSVSRHHSSPRENSVHRQDVAALVELATVARECGARADLAVDGETGFGRQTEFCVGGPGANPRMSTHVRTILPALSFAEPGAIAIGDDTFHYKAGVVEYVVLARVWGPAGGKPVFLLAGQTAPTNLAAARYLTGRHRRLFAEFGADRPFCLVLRVVEPAVYGTDVVQLASDVTGSVFT